MLTDLPGEQDPRPSREEALEAVRTLISYIGDDPHRTGVWGTPNRVLKAWRECWGAGYNALPPDMTMFKEPGLNYDQMVTVRDMSVYSTCEHHLAPFFGTATVSYLPGSAGVVGISKLARAVEHFARRLQNQERLTAQIADFICSSGVSPNVGVHLSATHMCMVSRGVKQANARTITTALRGEYLTDPAVKAEFLGVIK